MFTRSLLSSIRSFNSAKRLFSNRNMSDGDIRPYIATHDGTFHCDDVTACFMLQQLDRFKNHDIVRTRDPEKLAGAEIIVDVGGELDVERLRLDHHQRSFNQTILDYHPNIIITNPANPTRLSSSGLVYSLFGKDVITKLTSQGPDYSSLKTDNKRMVDAIFVKAYTEFFEEIDAIDNGVETVSGDDVIYNYHINSGVSSRVGRMNPRGLDPSAELRLKNFKEAMAMVGAELSEGIIFLSKFWWPARQKFREVVKSRLDFDPSGQMVLVEKDQLVGWIPALFEIEIELGLVGEIKFIVFDEGSEKQAWRVTAMPIKPKSFICRTPLREEWRGKRDEDLQKVSGIPDATFVHMNGFTGGAKTLEGAKALIGLTLGLK